MERRMHLLYSEINMCKFHMNTSENSTTDIFKNSSVEYRNGEVIVINSNPDRYSGVYKEMADLLGDAAAVKIWKRFSGLNISFPQRLYSKEFTRQFIEENMGTMRPHDIARNVNLSERRVRQIINDIKNEKENGRNA